MKNAVGWIDFSSSDRERVLDVLNALNMPGTVDELGIGHVRDAFSDCLFPGFSTIQTRAKYFITVPRIIADYLGQSTVTRRRTSLETYLREKENKLAERLVTGLGASGNGSDSSGSNEMSFGIIGSRTKKGGAQRRPSSIYWAGLRTLQIIKHPYSLAEFCRYVDQLNGTLFIRHCNNWPSCHKVTDGSQYPRVDLNDSFSITPKRIGHLTKTAFDP